MTRKRPPGDPPGSVRIIGGDWRGRRLEIPPGTALRPTPDRVRETLFNWLQERIAGARCLDAFAGTGSLGLEALSRGAAEAWFVERDAVLADALHAHIELLGAPRGRVVHDDARRFLERPPPTAFDLVFVDPPFEQPVEPIVAALGPFLNESALVYVERPADPGLPDIPGADWVRHSRAASVVFGLLRLQ